jgi:hypothetical protein
MVWFSVGVVLPGWNRRGWLFSELPPIDFDPRSGEALLEHFCGEERFFKVAVITDAGECCLVGWTDCECVFHLVVVGGWGWRCVVQLKRTYFTNLIASTIKSCGNDDFPQTLVGVRQSGE